MNIRTFQVNLFQENTYVAWKEGPGCVIVDPGCYTEEERRKLFDFIESEKLHPEAVLLTHGHPDHIFCVKECQIRYGCRIYMHAGELMVLANAVKISVGLGLKAPESGFEWQEVTDGDTIAAAGFSFRIIHTPGHTPGGCCFLEEAEQVLFTGDTLFAGTIGRTDLLFGDYDSEIRSIMDKLMALDSDIEIRPGHAYPSTIGYERTHNPMLEPFNEPEEDMSDELKPIEIHA